MFKGRGTWILLAISWFVVVGMLLWANCTRTDIVEGVHTKLDLNAEKTDHIQQTVNKIEKAVEKR